MTPRLPRWVWGMTFVGLLVAVWVLVARYPWTVVVAALAAVNPRLLLMALLINLLSPLAKGWGWQLVLRPIARVRWWVAEEAMLIGSAVASIAPGVSGEAARISLVMQREGVALRPAVLSVVWSRGTEMLGLALVLVVAPLFLALPAPLRGLQIGAGVALGTVLLVPHLYPGRDWIQRLPPGLRAGALELATMSWGTRLVGPIAWALVSWLAEWATYHYAFRAVHLAVTPAASLTALIAANLGGLVRLTPANVGIMQAAVVGALLPFGVPAGQAVVGGLALQAVEVVPILVLASLVAGRSGLARVITQAAAVRDAA